ncbi:MAG: hypothetical protein ACNY01_13410 [Desulfobacteria bacterium]
MSWTADEIDTALAGPVAPVLFDHEGTADIAALLESVPGTDFTGDEIARILDNDTPPKDWEVGEGEAIAEAYLTHHRDSFFPWPDGRDIRKPKSSLPGADLVGFHKNNEKTRFAFGEVKTSKENKTPPTNCTIWRSLPEQAVDRSSGQQTSAGQSCCLSGT